MSQIYVIPRARCYVFRALFDAHSDLRVLIDGVFDNCVGEAFADHPDQPKAMMLKVGVYRIMAGEATAAGSLFDHVEVGEEIVIPATPAWMTAMLGLKTRGLETIERSMDAYGVQQLDSDLLQGLAAQLPQGFDCHEVDASLLCKLGPSLQPNRIANFDSEAQFLSIGLGACAMYGEAIVCAATSYAVSKTGVEIAMATHPDYRRRGLASPIAARCALMVMERGLLSAWHAANAASSRIACRLGFRLKGSCLTYDVVKSGVLH